MKYILTLSILLFALLGFSQDLSSGKYDSIQECAPSNITLVYYKGKTAVYWKKKLLFKPSKNFYYYFESGEVLGEVNPDSKAIFYSVFDKENGDYRRYLNDEKFIAKRNNNCNQRFCKVTDPVTIQKASHRFCKIHPAFINLETIGNSLILTDVEEVLDLDTYIPSFIVKNGIYDLANNNWVVKNGNNVQRYNDLFLVGVEKADKTTYDVYSMVVLEDYKSLIKIETVNEETPEFIAQLLNADSVKLNSNIYENVYSYYVFKNNKVGFAYSSLFDNKTFGNWVDLTVPAEFEYIIPINSSYSYLVQNEGILSLYYEEDSGLKLTLDTLNSTSYSNVIRYHDNSPDNYYVAGDSYLTNQFRLDVINDSLLLIIDNYLESVIPMYDEEGNLQYDEDGFEMMDTTLGEFSSGLFNNKSKKWVIPKEHYQLHYLNDKIIALIPEYEKEYKIRTGNYKYEIYDLNGNLLMGNIIEENMDVLNVLYPNSVITDFENDDYLIKTDTNMSWINFHLFQYSNIESNNWGKYPEYHSFIKKCTKDNFTVLPNNYIAISKPNEEIIISYWNYPKNESIPINSKLNDQFWYEHKTETINKVGIPDAKFKNDSLISFLNINQSQCFLSISNLGNGYLLINDIAYDEDVQEIDEEWIPYYDDEGWPIYETIVGKSYAGILNLTDFTWTYQTKNGKIIQDDKGGIFILEYELQANGLLDREHPKYSKFDLETKSITKSKAPKSNQFDSYTIIELK